MKKILLVVCIASGVILSQCTSKNQDKNGGQIPVAESNVNPPVITPENIQSGIIPGFNYPEDSVALKNWINEANDQKIYNHGWGLWTALTAKTDQRTASDESLLVFETWESIDQIRNTLNPNKEEVLKSNKEVSERGLLKRPGQLDAKKEQKAVSADTVPTMLVAVKYSPGAASHTINNKLLLVSQLKAMVAEGKKDIPAFPQDAVTIKPVYMVATAEQIENGTFQLPVWPGYHGDKMESFGPDQWDAKSYVTVTKSTSEPSKNTYSLEDFIHFRLDDVQAEYIAELDELGIEGEGQREEIEEGDYALLVAMHVTTREIERWTWQTYFWSKNPDAPEAPSSKEVAMARPQELQGAARNYAMSIAYNMVTPAQPNRGGTMDAMPVYAFNPYLEAGFDPSTFDRTRDNLYTLEPGTKSKQLVNEWGMQTNCISCHAFANFDRIEDGTSAREETALQYAADAYVDFDKRDALGGINRDDVTIYLDMAWSIQGNLIYDEQPEATASTKE